jgi:hypothetical protein
MEAQMQRIQATRTKDRMNISYTNLLCILFIGLKLTGFIHWSWVWVLSPVWISYLVAIGIVATAYVITGDVKPKRYDDPR